MVTFAAQINVDKSVTVEIMRSKFLRNSAAMIASKVDSEVLSPAGDGWAAKVLPQKTSSRL
jgi:hypothetical protein